MTGAERIGIASVGLGLAVLGLKGAAWWLTGSVAFYADALESAVNVATAAGTLIALRVAARPADTGQPDGHGKAEFFAVVIEGVLIAAAAWSIFHAAWSSWNDPHGVMRPTQGLTLNAAATVLSGLWSALLIRVGSRLRSPALAADGRHRLSAMVSSLGVLIGVVIAVLTGRWWLDPALAAAVGVYVLWGGMNTIIASVNGLTDATPELAVIGRIRTLVAEHGEGAIEAHELRMRQAGKRAFLEFHLVVPGSMSVSEAHAICDRIEDALTAEMADLVITIHVEPEVKAKQQGVLVL